MSTTKNTSKKMTAEEAKIEEMRKTVIEQELSARSWKAFWEKMYYSLECEKIEPEYKAYQERVRVRITEEQEKRAAMIEEMQKKALEAGLLNEDGTFNHEAAARLQENEGPAEGDIQDRDDNGPKAEVTLDENTEGRV